MTSFRRGSSPISRNPRSSVGRSFTGSSRAAVPITTSSADTGAPRGADRSARAGGGTDSEKSTPLWMEYTTRNPLARYTSAMAPDTHTSASIRRRAKALRVP